MHIYLQVITSLAFSGNTLLTCVFIQLNPLYVITIIIIVLDILFFDASKAFDRINYGTMFKQLILRDVPIIIVRVLCFRYRAQELCIQWGNMTSSFFNISNGVRQGGILSLKLFSVYIDDLPGKQ